MRRRAAPDHPARPHTPRSAARSRGALLAGALALALVAGATSCTGKGTRAISDEPIATLVSGEHGLPHRTLPDDAADSVAAPINLTASDGTGLKLTSLEARAVVEGPLAFTELHLTFRNPASRTVEGRFAIDMPPGAAISRFAMKIGARWQEGEVVERQAARVVFESFMHRGVDPALLEQESGNKFSARVFPIPANGTKELIIAYSQELPDANEPYRLELAGLPTLERLDARVVLNDGSVEGRVVELHERDYTPDHDLEISAAGDRDAATGLRHKNLTLARVTAGGSMSPDPIRRLTVLFDTSASRALSFDGQVRRLGELVRAIASAQGSGYQVRVLCFDQEVVEVFSGPAADFGREHLDAIYTRRPLGASDLHGALRAVALSSRALVDEEQRLLIISDGLATAGASEQASLEEQTRALAERGFARVDAVIDGGLQDRDALQGITTAGLPRHGIVADTRAPIATIAGKLLRTALVDTTVRVPGSEWVWPDTLDGVQPGDPVLVYADLPADAAMSVVLTGQDGIEETIDVPLTQVERPLLERAWVSAQIERLSANRSRIPADTEKGEQARDELEKKIVGLSTDHRVLSEFTAMLVLETEADYRRFNIDRDALAGILAISLDEDRVMVVQRTPYVAPWGPWHSGISRGVSTWETPTIEPARRLEARGDTHNGGPEEPTPDDDDEAGGMGQRHKGEEGKMGKPTLKQKSGLYAMRGPRNAIPQLARNFDPDLAARNAGILGGSTSTSPAFLEWIEANSNGDVWGGLDATQQGEVYPDGFGLVGTGRTAGDRGLVSRPRALVVREGRHRVTGPMDADIVRRIVRAHRSELQRCYARGLFRQEELQGRVELQYDITADGKVAHATIRRSSLGEQATERCMANAARRWKFPRPRGHGAVVVTSPIAFTPGTGETSAPLPPMTQADLAREQERLRRWDVERAEVDRLAAEAKARAEQDRRRRQREIDEAVQRERAEAERTKGSPYTGELFDVMTALASGQRDEALERAVSWTDRSPGDIAALIGLGEALEASGDTRTAARVYGSLIDLYPSRADLRRYAGQRLERVGRPGELLAIDTYARAVEQRPDHPNSHRLHALALARAGHHERAFAAIVAGITHEYPARRFQDVDRILREDAGLIAAAWIAREPNRAAEITGRAVNAGVKVERSPSTRFVLSWETDVSDVDLHVYDANKDHASFRNRTLESGGELYADVTTGYGPECFTIPGAASAHPYKLQAHYYRRGPVGFGMGTLQVIEHDGAGVLRFEPRPFILMKDEAFVELGSVDDSIVEPPPQEHI